MVEDYLSDREQEEALRIWWRENWRWIVGGIVLGVALLFGWFRWQDYRVDKGEEASKQYDELKAAVTARDTDKATKELADLTSQHDSSAYTQQGRLLLAKVHADAGKYEDALQLLREVSDKSKDAELASLAKLRAARVLIQLGKHDEAISSLKIEDLGSFAGVAHEIRGDAYLAKGDQNGARGEYAAALTANDAQIDRNILELKLQDVGGSKPAPATTAQAKDEE